MGIIVLSVAILPMFGLGGMQLYSAEVTGVSYDKLSPRIADTAKHMWLTYIGLTLGEGILLWLLGMNKFDSLCYSMATISTGGFATHNDSVAGFGPAIQWTITFFMLLSAINFTQLIYLFRGKPQRLVHDEETKWYVGACLVAGVILTVGLLIYTHQLDSIRYGFFTAIATITSTGFVATDYMVWPPVLWMVVFFLMFTGGASGSTSGGMKWVRLAIFAKSANAEIKRRIHPNAVIPVRFNGVTMREQTTSNIVAFVFFYVVIIVLASICFCGCGIGFDESIGIAVSMIGNVGVSIGQWGSSGCYEALPAVAKWVATFVMIIGRLEIFTVLLLFSKSLWRK
jgi:trk system potassium uptake protein TrkH